MSTSSGFSQMSSQRSASKSPEKLGRDLNLGFTPNLRRRFGSAPEFFQRPEKMAKPNSLDLFPQQAGFGNSNGVDSRVYKSAITAPQTSQMTIFYAGQVFVFNNFPAERVGEVMYLAGRETSKLNIPTASPAVQPVLVGTPADSLSSTSPVSARNQTPPPPPPVTGDLPMARKASIQRFLEKRRDRLTARAPYQSFPPPTKIAGAVAGTNSWLGLAVQPQH